MEADLSNRVGEAYERFVPGSGQGQLIELEHLVRYGWAAQLAEGRRALDAGCGVGYGTAMLAAAGAREAVGVDVSEDAVAAAAASAPPNATFRAGEVHALPFADASFDLVVCFEVLEHLERQDAAIAELARVLAPDGVLVTSSPNRDVYPEGNPHHVHEYLPEELRAALERQFAHVALRRQHDWVASAVLDDEQVAARRGRVDVPMLKVHPAGPETYTLALASRAALPAVDALATLGGVEEVQAWLQAQWRVYALERRHEVDRADIATLQGIEARLRGDNATLLAELESLRSTLRDIHGSPAWRITKPLRALSRLRR